MGPQEVGDLRVAITATRQKPGVDPAPAGRQGCSGEGGAGRTGELSYPNSGTESQRYKLWAIGGLREGSTRLGEATKRPKLGQDRNKEFPELPIKEHPK